MCRNWPNQFSVFKSIKSEKFQLNSNNMEVPKLIFIDMELNSTPMKMSHAAVSISVIGFTIALLHMIFSSYFNWKPKTPISSTKWNVSETHLNSSIPYDNNRLTIQHLVPTKRSNIRLKSCSIFCKILFFFFYLGFLLRAFTNHRTPEEGGGHFINSSPQLPPASQTLRH